VSGGLLYLDSSAILKIVVPEPESKALFKFLNDWPLRISSELARTEVLRALRRAGAKAPSFRRGQKTIERLGLLPVDSRVLTDAAFMKPAKMRSLDAIHLATALSLGSELAGIVTYDERLSEAASLNRVAVWAPR
jgi:predicted nucleic acid-binding protein